MTGRPTGRTVRGSCTRCFLPLAVVLVLSWSAAARAEDGCAPAITLAEQANNNLPAHILQAIGVVESGRRDPATGRLGAWPWSVNAAGDSRMFDTRSAAIAFVREAQARGIRSIDVGCMQVNLQYHPNAFATLEEAFAPASNVRYATGFLLDLRQRTGDWLTATGNYHSATPDLSREYARRVQAILSGEQQDTGRFASDLPPAWSPPLSRPAEVVLMAAAGRRVRVVEPGIEPIRRGLLREAANLPRVYHPGG